ncbi:MAG: hypothetical protein DI617_03885 [Streptococcus pyogenes]|nr:MAG: hypothetical protein DI617_03885 [Streptococcus pyogenes]
MLTEIGNFSLLLIILFSPLLISNKLDKIDAKIKQQKVIIYKVDNVGAKMIGTITAKEIIDGHYTVTASSYGKFLVTEEQYNDISVGDTIPDYLKGRGN